MWSEKFTKTLNVSIPYGLAPAAKINMIFTFIHNPRVVGTELFPFSCKRAWVSSQTSLVIYAANCSYKSMTSVVDFR